MRLPPVIGRRGRKAEVHLPFCNHAADSKKEMQCWLPTALGARSGCWINIILNEQEEHETKASRSLQPSSQHPARSCGAHVISASAFPGLEVPVTTTSLKEPFLVLSLLPYVAKGKVPRGPLNASNLLAVVLQQRAEPHLPPIHTLHCTPSLGLGLRTTPSSYIKAPSSTTAMDLGGTFFQRSKYIYFQN